MSDSPAISPLAAAAAALCPERAAALLARWPDPAVAAEAGALAARPRAARLAALAAACLPPHPSAETIRAAASAERPRLAAVVATVGHGRGPGGALRQAQGEQGGQLCAFAPVLARLAWERVSLLQAERDRARAPFAR